MPSPIGESPSPVTIPPVEIEGDAATAAPPSPNPGSVVTIPPVYVAALGPAGVAVGLAAVAGLSYSEGQKLRALYDCVTE